MKGMFGLHAFALGAGMLVAAAAPAHAGPITLTLDPVHPTTADSVHLRAHFAAGTCWDPLAPPFDPATFDGRTITLRQQPSGIGLPPCGPPPPDFETVLPALVEGSWSVHLLTNGVEGMRAFDVTAPSTDLFLHGGRFVATAVWRGHDGVSHAANALALDDGAGAFWFFDSGNVELTIKMLDGATVNGQLWVFLASMTDVAYTVTVADRNLVCITTPCPNTRTYEGIAGHNANVLDTSAFAAPGAADGAFR
jgi:hypothetical protein